MKDIYTILGEIGLTVPEDKKTAFDTAVRENYKTVSEHDKVVRARDDFKSQFDTANNTISELNKNKGDVDALQKKIDEYECYVDAYKKWENICIDGETIKSFC